MDTWGVGSAALAVAGLGVAIICGIWPGLDFLIAGDTWEMLVFVTLDDTQGVTWDTFKEGSGSTWDTVDLTHGVEDTRA